MALISVNESVITVFDMVYILTQSKDYKCLNLRFAYIYLNRIINALNIAGEITYTNIYLNIKNNLLVISSS
jgi:hypothetical protein